MTEMINKFLILVILIIPNSTFGTNLEQGLRNLTRYEKWMSVEIRVPLTGMFIASRAATENKRKDVTLVFTMSPKYMHCRGNVEIIFNTGSEQYQDREREGLVEIQIDSRHPSLSPGKIITSLGNPFVFFRIDQHGIEKNLFNGKELSINVRGVGLSNFSLSGFKKAWRIANNTCMKYDS